MSSLGNFLALVFFYMVYLLLGGCMFYNIECTEEMASKRREVAGERESIILIIEGLEHLRDEVATHDLAPIINRHMKHMIENRTYEEAKEKYRICETWSFFNSFFFGFTSVTTIGYGKIVPQTQLGRGACLIFSIFGIPLNTLVIGVIGNFFMNKGSK